MATLGKNPFAKTGKKSGVRPDINVTPLVDVVLVLLIILMVTATAIVSKTIPMELPEAATGDAMALPTTVSVSIDAEGQLYVLEVNSLPSLGEHGSYLVGAERVGLDFPKFVNRLVEVASARYFGTPEPPMVRPGAADPAEQVFRSVTQRRDVMEQRLRDWVAHSSHTTDPVGLREAVRRAGRTLGSATT